MRLKSRYRISHKRTPARSNSTQIPLATIVFTFVETFVNFVLDFWFFIFLQIMPANSNESSYCKQPVYNQCQQDFDDLPHQHGFDEGLDEALIQQLIQQDLNQPNIHFDVVDEEEFRRVVQQEQNELMGDLMPDDDFDLNNFVIVDGRLYPRDATIPHQELFIRILHDVSDPRNELHELHLDQDPLASDRDFASYLINTTFELIDPAEHPDLSDWQLVHLQAYYMMRERERMSDEDRALEMIRDFFIEVGTHIPIQQEVNKDIQQEYDEISDDIMDEGLDIQQHFNIDFEEEVDNNIQPLDCQDITEEDSSDDEFDTADIIQPCRDDWPDKTEEDYLNLIARYIDDNGFPVDPHEILNRMNIARIYSENSFYDQVNKAIGNTYVWRHDWPDKTEEEYLDLIIQYIDVNDIPVDQDDIFNRMNIARIKSEDDFYDEVDEVIDNIYMDHVTRYIESNNIPINPNDIMMRIDTTAIHTVVDLNVAVDRVLHDIILGDTDTQ